MRECLWCGHPMAEGDRHSRCSACREGSRSPFAMVRAKQSTVCVCHSPRPEFIPIFGGYQCGRCGKKVVSAP